MAIMTGEGPQEASAPVPFPGSVEELDRMRQKDLGVGPLGLPPWRTALSAAFVTWTHKHDEKYTRRRFILEQLERVPASERPTTGAEREDLERCLIVRETANRPPLGDSIRAIRWRIDAEAAALDAEAAAHPGGTLAQELASIYGIEPPVKADRLRWILPTLADWNYSTLLDPRWSDEENLYRAALAFHWPRAWDTWRTANATNGRRLAVRGELARADAGEVAKLPAAEPQLVAWLEVESCRPVPGKPDWREPLPEADGMYGQDAALAAHLDTIDRGQAEKYRKSWREAWAAEKAQQTIPGAEPRTRAEVWRDVLHVDRVLAHVGWVAFLRPALLEHLAAKTRRKDAPGLVYPVLTSLVSVSRRGAQTELFDPQTARFRDHRGQVVGELRMGPAIDGRLISIEALGLLETQRFVRWLVHAGYEKRFIRLEPNFAELWTEGSWHTLAAAVMGTKPEQIGRNVAERFQEAAYALAAVSIDTPKGIGQIYAVHHHRGGGRGNPSRIEHHLVGPMRPGYVQEELAANRVAENKWIVPVPMPSMLPPMTGHNRQWPSQGLLQLLGMREFRIHAETLAKRGTVSIPEKRWQQLADEASLPARMLDDVLGVFVAGKDDAPPFLTRPDGGWNFGLADGYGKERAAILSAAKRLAGGRAAGRKAADARAGGSFGHRRPPRGQ